MKMLQQHQGLSGRGEGGIRARGRWGGGMGGFHSAEGREEGKKRTITDEKMRCEEGKMLLLEAFYSNQ